MIAERPFSPTRIHVSRLLSIWRSAGWPVRDAIEIDLLAANWVTLSVASGGHETLKITDVGLKVLADARNLARRASSPHDRLAGRVGQHLLASGRIVWRELSLRARFTAATPSPCPDERAANETLPLPAEDGIASLAPSSTYDTSWRVARPDVFSVRNTSVEHYLQPMVHEIKVNRADLLSDLRNGAKRESYRWLCCECFYVFPHGIAQPQEIPDGFGVWILHGAVEHGRLELVRSARHFPCKLPFEVWLALAKATPVFLDGDTVQDDLREHEAVDPHGGQVQA